MNILFDLDGTLTDPREGIVACLKHALRGLACPTPPDSELVRYIGPPLQESFASLLRAGRKEQVDAAVELYRERFAAKGMFENAVYPGVPAALARLQALGASLHVATAKPHVFAERILEHFGLKCYFQTVYGSELDGTRTGKVDLIAHVLEKESMSPHSTFMVGDRSQDVVGAKANGVFPVAALWGYGTREELRDAGATVFCERPELLSEVLPFHGGVAI